jgi:hypothetical protein
VSAPEAVAAFLTGSRNAPLAIEQR